MIILKGLAFHDDLMNPVKSNEAYRFTEIIQTEAEKILPGIVVQLTGGFRRYFVVNYSAM